MGTAVSTAAEGRATRREPHLNRSAWYVVRTHTHTAHTRASVCVCVSVLYEHIKCINNFYFLLPRRGFDTAARENHYRIPTTGSPAPSLTIFH